MKKIILSLFVIMLACQLPAQHRYVENLKEYIGVGVTVGGILPNYSYTKNAALNNLPFDSLMFRLRPTFGVTSEIPLFGGRFFVSPEVALANRGDSRLFKNGSLWVRYQTKVNYLEARVPIAVAIPVTQTFKPYVFVAPSFSLALDTVGPFASGFSQYSFDYPQTVDTTVTADINNLYKYDYGVTVGAGVRYRIMMEGFSVVLKLEGGYHFGLRDTYSDAEHDWKTLVQNGQTSAYVPAKQKRFNRGIQAAFTIVIPLGNEEDFFYWSDIKRKNNNRGLYGF